MTIFFLNSDQKVQRNLMDYYQNVENQSNLALNEVPPQSYHLHQTMKMVKFVAYTMMTITIILGSFILMLGYIQTYNRYNCARYNQQMSESQSGPYFEPLTAFSSDETAAEVKKLPVHILMDGDSRDMMKGNRKGKISCEVERKTATQIIASDPKMLITPYGNITTDPKLIHVTGEKIIFTCSNGKPFKNKRNKKTKLSAIFKSEKPIEVVNETDSETKEKGTRSKRSAEALSKYKCTCLH